jgi:hypothetical protein
MSIIPTEKIPVAPYESYVIPKPSSDQKLDAPSHSELHTELSEAVRLLHLRMDTVEQEHINLLWPQVEQSRKSANTWVIPGQLSAEVVGPLLLPPLWNLTGRSVLFDAVRATAYTEPLGQDIIIDILTGPEITGPLKVSSMHSIFKPTQRLTIPVGGNVSPIMSQLTNGFADGAHHAIGEVVVVQILQIGTDAPGADLTIQLLRDL